MSFMAIDDDLNEPFIAVRVITSGTLFQAYLCTPEEDMPMANRIHTELAKAVQELNKKKRPSGLTVVEQPKLSVVREVPDALRKAQGRQQQRTRR